MATKAIELDDDLTVEDMELIVTEMQLGKPPSIVGAAADKFRAEVQPDLDRVAKDGGRIEVGQEWPKL